MAGYASWISPRFELACYKAFEKVHSQSPIELQCKIDTAAYGRAEQHDLFEIDTHREYGNTEVADVLEGVMLDKRWQFYTSQALLLTG